MKFYMFFFLIIISNTLSALTGQDFIQWWSEYRTHPKLPAEICLMEDYVISSGLIDHSSEYWNTLNKMNIKQITELGFENFKQTIAQNYFTWVVSPENPYASDMIKLVPHPNILIDPTEFYQKYSFFSAEESLKFNTITFYFLNYMVNIAGAGSLLEKLEEPLIGNPPCLTYKGKRVSQDLFNSLLEFMPIAENCDLDNVSTIIEVGAGSGRTAFCFLSLAPHIKYIIADYPPALYISQTYLSAVFSNKKVMKFRPFSNFAEIAKEFSQADIIFLTPDQLELIPDNTADLFLAVDCLHEMKPSQIEHYFNEAERLASLFYFKCWQHTVVPYDSFVFTQSSYPVKPHWKALFNHPCVIPSNFFHAFYEMREK